VKIIKPETITDAILATSDIPETDYAEFAMGTTYAAGNRCIVATGVEVIVLDVAPATAWAAGDIITGQTSAKTCVCVAKLTTLTYQVRERSGSFTLGEIIGVTGTPAKLADQGAANPTFTAPTDKVHKIYESLVDSNVGNYPPTDVLTGTPKWLEVGATNRWKAFDGKNGSKVSQANSINYTFNLPVVDSIALIGLEAASVLITVKDSGGTVINTETISMIDNSAVIDWYTYFFEEILSGEDVVRFDIPKIYDGTLEITVTNTGAPAAVGEIVIGNSAVLGRMQFTPKISITDYSVKGTDAYGRVTITERAYSLRMECDVEVDNEDIDDIYNLFATYRVTPLVWVESELPGPLVVYGFYKEFEPTIEGVDFSMFGLIIEGLT